MADRDEEPYYGSDMWRETEGVFQPLRRESRAKVLLAFIVGPLAWVITLAAVSFLVHRTRSLEFGLLVTLAAFAVSMVLLPLLYLARRREERAYARRSQGRS